MPVIAVTDKSPEQVMAWLIKTGQAQRVTFVPQSGVVNPDAKYRRHIFIIGTREYDRNAVAVRDLPDHTVYVFGNERLLTYYGLDTNAALDEAEPTRARLAPIGSYLEDLKRKAIANSLLHSLMTFIYTLPSKTHQKPVTNDICKWIYSGDKTTIDELVDNLPIKISGINRHRLVKILAQPVTNRLRQAFVDLRTGKCETNGEAVLRHDVQVFELGYIRGNVEKVENIVDARVGNQGVEK